MVQNRTRPPSIKDVAAVAGVSHQTVSRVLSGFTPISEATKAKVLAAVDEMGYRPNIAAQALVTSRSRTIGVLVSDLTNYGPATAVAAIELAAREAGYRLSLTNIASSSDASINSALGFLLGQSIEALAIITPQLRVYEALRDARIDLPVVVLEPTPRPFGNSVAVDQQLGTRLATKHLIDLGHREILYISGPQDSIEADVRMQGFLDEILANDLALRAPVLGDWTSSFGYVAGLGLLPHADFTAVVAANDQMAFGFVHACREMGVRVPEDISIVAFDDLPETAHFAPALTTVRQDFAEVGRRSVAVLLSEIDGRSSPQISLIAPELAVRESTAPPRR